ncbi:MAG: ankyrin repeat domain-containing protein [Myxococcota bacterium]
MRRPSAKRWVVWGTLLLLPGAGQGSEEDLHPNAPVPGPGNVNRVMGIGDVREPEPFTREQRLLHAVRTGDRPTVERALELGVSVHTQDELERSAFLLAVRDAESLELARVLQGAGARVDEADVSGRTPLSYAASHGDLDLVTYLVEAGAEVDGVDDLGRTPLYYAALWNHPEVIRFLHGRGANLDVRGRHDETPLIGACIKNADAAARVLLELGADPTLVDRKGRSARDRARLGTPACQTAHPES